MLTDRKKQESHIRSDYDVDFSRIISTSYFRAMNDKTQVYSPLCSYRLTTTRMTHVIDVYSIADNIAKRLGADRDLVRAIAFAHDIGHPCFGHEGERELNALSMRYLNKPFWHEKNGLRVLDNLALIRNRQNEWKNLNLTYAVRDGVICHNGESNPQYIAPRDLSVPLSKIRKKGAMNAVTIEGCIVKISDKFAYIGTDIQDSIELGHISFDGTNRNTAMSYFVSDLLNNSTLEKLCLSDEAHDKMRELLDFSKDNVWNHRTQKPMQRHCRVVIDTVFEYLVHKDCEEFTSFLAPYLPGSPGNNRKIYKDITDNKTRLQAIIDFISTSSDTEISNLYDKILKGDR